MENRVNNIDPVDRRNLIMVIAISIFGPLVTLRIALDLVKSIWGFEFEPLVSIFFYSSCVVYFGIMIWARLSSNKDDLQDELWTYQYSGYIIEIKNKIENGGKIELLVNGVQQDKQDKTPRVIGSELNLRGKLENGEDIKVLLKSKGLSFFCFLYINNKLQKPR